MSAFGHSSPVRADTITHVPIILDETQCITGTSITQHEFTAPLREGVTEQVRDVFDDLRRATLAANSIDLGTELRDETLRRLATYGSRAFRKLFKGGADEALDHRFQDIDGTPVPTIASAEVKFPWEVLHDGDDATVERGDPEGFWGLRLAPARVPHRGRDTSRYASEQAYPSSMLMCLHQRLQYAHGKERPEIERLVCGTSADVFSVLSLPDFAGITDGKGLLRRLYSTEHNMLHFACHCVPSEAGGDSLQISVLDEGGDGTTEVELDTWTFEDVTDEKGFKKKPLVFLNACESAGGADMLRLTFNLPRVLADRDAGAIIATAAAVPDVFAAAFARSFYKRFLQPEVGADGRKRYTTIGEALRLTRREFVFDHNNPLALAYGLYTPAHYRLAGTPRERFGP